MGALKRMTIDRTTIVMFAVGAAAGILAATWDVDAAPPGDSGAQDAPPSAIEIAVDRQLSVAFDACAWSQMPMFCVADVRR